MAITILYFALPNLPAAFLLQGTGASAPAGFCKIVTLTLSAIPPPTTPLGRGKLGGKLPRRAWATPRPGSTGGAAERHCVGEWSRRRCRCGWGWGIWAMGWVHVSVIVIARRLIHEWIPKWISRSTSPTAIMRMRSSWPLNSRKWRSATKTRELRQKWHLLCLQSWFHPSSPVSSKPPEPESYG